ncbi:zona pellucida sperm-binding protein 2-like [Pleurodeles waltl]|uniref:zona pellucida sperm-binding protein 2-like n=1 Tax=Pleurodeles waltl TaxID=8319 RepID=UPI00370947A7
MASAGRSLFGVALRLCSEFGTSSPLARLRLFFLLGCLVLKLTDAEILLEFPGHVSCLNDSIRVTLPEDERSVKELCVLDSEQKMPVGCDYFGDKWTIVASPNCMEYEGGEPHLKLHLVCSVDAKYKKVTYNVSCKDVQYDQPLVKVAQAVNCTEHDMSIAFALNPATSWAEVLSTWYLGVHTVRTFYWLFSQANQLGYNIIHDQAKHLLIMMASYNTSGVQVYKQGSHVLYLADTTVIAAQGSHREHVHAPMMCVSGPFICNATHLTIVIPAFPGTINSININGKNIPINSLAKNGVFLDTQRGFNLAIDRHTWQGNCTYPQLLVFNVTLAFLVRLNTIPVTLYPNCPCQRLPSTPVSMCTADGFMDFEVLAGSTVPDLDLRTVKIRDGSCQPTARSKEKLDFHIPLYACGTTFRLEDDYIVYENEVRALYLVQSPISRDSEYRLTVKCHYRNKGLEVGSANVVTPLPPISLARSEGPLSLVLNLFPDDSYNTPYSISQYPVVKLLREPVYLEVQLLNRNDPNLELMLNDCWATSQEDPTSQPRWNVVVDGCDFKNDNYRTLFHSVGQVSYPNYRKRFEVKTFAFVSSSQAFKSLVYFHCSAIVCDKLTPDSTLCTTICPASIGRRRRRAAAEPSSGMLASLPGPVIFEGEFSRKSKDHVAELGAPLEEGAWFTLVIIVCVLIVSVAIFKCSSRARCER